MSILAHTIRLTALAALVASAAVVSGCSTHAAAPEAPRSALVAHPQPADGINAEVYSGDVHARYESQLGFRVTGPDSYAIGSEERSSDFAFDAPPLERGRVGAGTIHHIAWATDGFLSAWRQRVIGMGCVATPVIDRGDCHSIYFREPSGVLFEISAPSDVRSEGSAETVIRTRRISPKVDPRVHAGPLG